jgi:orotidine-5'-phosphate decarboxylase
VLAPGFGAQGGTVHDVRRLFGSAALVLPSSSRDVLRLVDPSAMAEVVRATNHELRS